MDTQTSFSTLRSGKSRWLALLALVLAPTAFAAEAKQPPSFDRTLGFINELSDPVGSGFGLARMESSVCFRVHNAPADMSDYLQQRMAKTAAVTGLAVQQPGCVPNVDVVFTDDAKASARYFIREKNQLLRPFGNVAGTTQGAQALNDFARLEAPVRWWQTTVQVDWNGDVAMNLPQGNSLVPVAGGTSHLAQGIRDRLLGSLILVEIGKLGDTSWDQLSDYLAMVALVQVNPQARLAGYDSILKLFDVGAAPQSLTAWDTAYLSSLYSINRHLYPHAQQGQLADLMRRSLQQQQVPQLAVNPK